jgi:membrane protein YqaA with SNARE-associated domain
MMTIQNRILLCLLRKKFLNRRETCWLVMAERHYRQRFRNERNDELVIPWQVEKSFKLLFLLTALRLLIDEPIMTFLGFLAMPLGIVFFLLTVSKWIYGLFI